MPSQEGYPVPPAYCGVVAGKVSGLSYIACHTLAPGRNMARPAYLRRVPCSTVAIS